MYFPYSAWTLAISALISFTCGPFASASRALSRLVTSRPRWPREAARIIFTT